MIIVIIGIFSYASLYRYDSDDFELETAASHIEAYLRYSQAKAMSEHTQVSISFNSDAKGWYFTVLGEHYYIPPHVSLSFSPISFNSLGEAVDHGSITIGDITITMEQMTGKIRRI